MCGIVGFTGKQKSLPFLLQGLSSLEYRGYDSAGVTLVNADSLFTCKSKGRIATLEEELKGKEYPQTCGIGHTRWATHGVPNNLNAHPHTNADNTISLVHNGIVENYAVLKERLEKLGYTFQSETDSECIVLLLDYYYRITQNMLAAMQNALGLLEGSYGLCVVTVYDPETVYVAKKESPMILGKTDTCAFCASDAPALLSYSKDILPLDDGDTAVLKPGEITVYDRIGDVKQQSWIHFPYDAQVAQKNGYDSFMLKEIYEQPSVIKETLRGRFGKEEIQLEPLEEMKVNWNEIRQIYWVACGTAYHACIYASQLSNRYTNLLNVTMPASEFRYGGPHIDEHTLCVFVSQSGETADTIAAVKLAKEKGCVTIAVTNVLGSTISRMTDAVLYTCAGLEIAVASTKAYTTQLVLLAVLILKISQLTGQTDANAQELIPALQELPKKIQETLQMKRQIEELAPLFVKQHDAYFIGRLLDYPSALEGALKLKEVSYVHADAYYAGELKHGPIALIEKDTVVVALATQKEIASKTISNIQETIARGAKVILITSKDASAEGFEHVLRLPDTVEELLPVESAILLQLIAYYVAKGKGCDIDKPRNLAKSVTVE